MNYPNKIFIKLIIFFFLLLIFLNCSTTVGLAGKAVSTVGKVGWKTAKTAGKVTYWTGKQAYNGTRTAIYMAKGKTIVPLEKRGNSFYVKTKINKKRKAKLLLDTGASSLQISRRLADKLNIKLKKKNRINVQLAGGSIVPAYKIILKQVKIEDIKIKNVEAVVLEQDDSSDGLLGMSFLNNFHFQIRPNSSELILERRVNKN